MGLQGGRPRGGASHTLWVADTSDWRIRFLKIATYARGHTWDRKMRTCTRTAQADDAQTRRNSRAANTAHRRPPAFTSGLQKLGLFCLPCFSLQAPSSPLRARPGSTVAIGHGALSGSWPPECISRPVPALGSPWATRQVGAGESTMPTEQRGLGPLSVLSLAAIYCSALKVRLPAPQPLTQPSLTPGYCTPGAQGLARRRAGGSQWQS